MSTPATFWVGDQLNHNSIIRAMRIANVPSANKAVYRHNDMDHLDECLRTVPAGIERVMVIFDGIFSMRGDFAPIDRIAAVVAPFREKFPGGLVTIVDDSHGIGAYGPAGRGTADHTGALPDVVIGTFGKAFGVNGGFIAASPTVIEAVRQKADTYIYTNPLSVADCAAAAVAVELCDGPEGRSRLAHLQEMTARFRRGIDRLGWQSIPGPHPIVPLLVRDTPRTHAPGAATSSTAASSRSASPSRSCRAGTRPSASRSTPPTPRPTSTWCSKPSPVSGSPATRLISGPGGL